MAWTANRRLYWTADKERVVEEGDPEAAFLFRAKGQSISENEMNRYRIRRKAGAGPIENKLGQPPEADKGGLNASLFETFEDQRIVDDLAGAGLTTVGAVQAASDEDLLAIDGIGPKTLEAIRGALG